MRWYRGGDVFLVACLKALLLSAPGALMGAVINPTCPYSPKKKKLKNCRRDH